MWCHELSHCWFFAVGRNRFVAATRPRWTCPGSNPTSFHLCLKRAQTLIQFYSASFEFCWTNLVYICIHTYTFVYIYIDIFIYRFAMICTYMYIDVYMFMYNTQYIYFLVRSSRFPRRKCTSVNTQVSENHMLSVGHSWN